MIQVYDDIEQLSQAAARLIFDLSLQSVDDRRRFSLVLSGGETPRRTYEILGEPVFYRQMPWKQSDVFWGDERCLPAGDSRRNEVMARNAFLDTIPIPAENIYPVPCAANHLYAAEQYEQTLRRYFGRRDPRFDLVLLGMGNDGHIASLFPGTVADAGQLNWVTSAYVEAVHMWRVTLTPTIINQARQIVFLVAGIEKAYAVQKALNPDPAGEQLPAHLIQPASGQITWLLDQEAASLLNPTYAA